MLLKTFGWSVAITVAGLVGGFFLGGVSGLAIVAILIVLEVSLSFDNAVVNATILKRMNAFWQKIFLTVGILIAVFGMRLVFPLLIVCLTGGVGPMKAIDLAIKGGDQETPGTYAYMLHEAHPSIAAFGGSFLLMLFLNFVFEDHKVKWLKPIERPLAKIGKLDQLSVVVALLVLVLASQFLAEDPGTVLFSGVLGVMTYLLVGGLGDLFEQQGIAGHDDADDDGAEDADATDDKAAAKNGKGDKQPGVGTAAGKAAFFLFMYLEVLDASFSFDGVIGAFAISQDIFIIAVGLGVGAMWIRSLTVYLVRQGTLDDYAYLEHGAMWAIGALATILFISIKHEVPEVITGLIGVGFIGAAFLASVRRNKRIAAEGGEVEHVHA
ncbi:DUF475 domain-containing protein [Dermacoccus abyssi]